MGRGQLPTRGFAHTQALEDAFLAIDAKLTTEEVIKELSQMAGRPQDDEDEKEKVADEDDGESDKAAAPGMWSSRVESPWAQGFLSQFLS